MGYFLGILIISFLLHGLVLIPFINLLYKLKLQRQKQLTKDAFNIPTPIFDNFNKHKAGIPLGGGLLIISLTTVLFLFFIPVLYFLWAPITSIFGNRSAEIKIILFTFISFGLVGLFDDVKKVFFGESENFFGMRLRSKLLLELILALTISFWLFQDLKISIIHIPFLGVYNLGFLYILFSALVIISFANAYNITDGLDGLAAGVLMIALIAFWVISSAILDTYLSLFIAVWVGGLIAFLYFNIYPARIFLGDVGALSFGATLAVIGLLLGKTFSLLVIGGIFVIEIFSSLIQLVSKKYRGKKIMAVAPLHLWFQRRGWHETTIVFRFWLVGIMLAVLGLWLALIA